ncbi:efflux RND transporter periplasmic adaptor subunit [Bizionia sediminis]|uniref:Efflux RND transporter periplasmic adaptor subunit n=1 Tax=Bizionia sediminis TaxID=1737064 RepID=A0ABW5KR35_9FLAO
MKSLYILAALLLLFTACGQTEKSTTEPAATVPHEDEITISTVQFENEGMTLGNISEQVFNERVTVNGLIDVPPQHKTRVSTFMGGYITKTPLLVGDKVTKGQLLVSLENTAYVALQQEFLEVAEQLSYLKNEYTRQKTLFDEKITSEKNYLKAESTYKSNLALYNGLYKKLTMLGINPKAILAGNITPTINIYAPMSGFVSNIHVSAGEYVSDSDVIMELVNTAEVHVALSVFEKDIMEIKKGQKIVFSIPEASQKKYEAEVHVVGTTINETTRRVPVLGKITNSETNYIIGMFVEAEIFTNQISAMALPNEAIIEANSSQYVLVLKAQTPNGFEFKKTAVKTGKKTEDFTEIQNPENLINQQLIITGTAMLLNESEGGHSH